MRYIKVVSQQVKLDATPHCPVGSVSSWIPSVVTPNGDRVADMDIEYIEKVCSVIAKGTKRNPWKWL